MELVQLDTPRRILGKTVQTKYALEVDPATTRIPGHWQAFMEMGGTSAIPAAQEAAIYAVYSDYESDMQGLYTLTLGTVSGAEASEEFKAATLPAGRFLQFTAQGAAPDCTVNAWNEVWAYFADETSEHKRAYTTDFEVYTGPEGVSIYIEIE